jgi:cytochrome c-type biogenesis protein CcmH
MTRPMKKNFFIWILIIFPWWNANDALAASIPSEQEQRYQALINELRCVQCQNQSIAESEAGIAQDIRQLVQAKILAGQTDQQIIDFLVERYGDFILYNPPFKPITYLLWLLPPLLLVIALWILKRSIRSHTTTQLSETEQLKIKQILEEKG